MSTMMNKRVRYRMYRGEDYSSSGGALTEPRVSIRAKLVEAQEVARRQNEERKSVQMKKDITR